MPNKPSEPAAKAKKPSPEKESAISRWISYRPEIQVLDCTIRDGGLMNDHQFEDGLVKAVYDACVAAGSTTWKWATRAPKNIVAGEHRRVEVLRGGRHPPHRGRQPADQNLRHGRCRTL